MNELRDLIETASAELERYRHPDTTEVERRLDEILLAGKLGAISRDRLESLTFYGGELQIATSYSVRGCSQTGDYRIPETVIDADDPILAVKVWAKSQRVAEARREVESAERVLAQARANLLKVEQEA